VKFVNARKVVTIELSILSIRFSSVIADAGFRLAWFLSILSIRFRLPPR